MLQSPKLQTLNLEAPTATTAQRFYGETERSTFPTMPRKKLVNPNKIKHIFP